MSYRSVTLAALALLVGACAQESADEPSSAREESATPPGAPDYGPAEAGRPETAGSTSESDAAMARLVGKMVVDGGGRLLGSTQRLVRSKGEETLAVISVSGSPGAKDREVVVPLERLNTGSVPGKLELAMSREQLLKQPKVAEGDYVEVEPWILDDEAAPAATPQGSLSSRGDTTGG